MKSTEIDRYWSSGKLSGGVFRCRIPLLDTPVMSGKLSDVDIGWDCSPPPEGQWGGGRYPEPPVTWLAGTVEWAAGLNLPKEVGRLGSDGDGWVGWEGWGHPESRIRRDGRREVGRRSAGGLDICIFICI